MNKAQASGVSPPRTPRKHRRPQRAAEWTGPADPQAAPVLGQDQVPAAARPALVRAGLVGHGQQPADRVLRRDADQLRTGWWVFILLGLEVLRQVHFLISEHSAAYNRFWTETVFGGFERMTHRRISDWTRFRIWRMADLGAVDRDHRHRDRQDHPHHADPGAAPRPAAALARAAVRGADRIYAHVRRAPVRRPLLVHVPRRGGRVLPRRHQDQVLRRLGPGPRARAGQGEHRLPGAPRAGRGARRLRAGRPAAVGAAGNRQDADGRGGGGRDRAAVRVRRPRRLHQHVHGRRHPQGEVAVPQAAAARAALRRRDRLLRRGRLAGQPRHDDPGRPRRAAALRCCLRPRGLPRVLLPVRRTRSGGWPSTRWNRRSPTSRTPGAAGR